MTKANECLIYEDLAVVHLIDKGINVAIRFNGLNSIDHNFNQEDNLSSKGEHWSNVSISFNGLNSNQEDDLFSKGEWVHWKTQAGHLSKRPSIIFSNDNASNQVQIGYVNYIGKTDRMRMNKFWIPASKCVLAEVPIYSNLQWNDEIHFKKWFEAFHESD